MRFLTLHQPWASLMALGEKRIDTRGWRTTYRGPLGIVAGRSPRFLGICTDAPYRSVLATHGYDHPETLERGRLLCVVTLEACVPTLQVLQAPREHTTAPHELAFGNYQDGRWAWLTRSRIRLEPSLPATGQLGVQEDPDLAARLHNALSLTPSHADAGATGSRAEAP
jgi:hypothetical protein